MIATLARKIRSAVNLQEGLIDLRAFSEVVRLLETLVEGLPGNDRPYHAGFGSYQSANGFGSGAFLPQESPIFAAELKHIFAFRSPKESLCLLMFLGDPGEILTHDHIAKRIRCTSSSVKVYISHMRKSLIAVGMEEPIINVHGRGYYMPVQTGQRVGEFIRDYQGTVFLQPNLQAFDSGPGRQPAADY